jgi:hypothetical protein
VVLLRTGIRERRAIHVAPACQHSESGHLEQQVQLAGVCQAAALDALANRGARSIGPNRRPGAAGGLDLPLPIVGEVFAVKHAACVVTAQFPLWSGETQKEPALVRQVGSNPFQTGQLVLRIQKVDEAVVLEDDEIEPLPQVERANVSLLETQSIPHRLSLSRRPLGEGEHSIIQVNAGYGKPGAGQLDAQSAGAATEFQHGVPAAELTHDRENLGMVQMRVTAEGRCSHKQADSCR